MSEALHKLRIGVDIGGTFTDLALSGSDGSYVQCKSPSTPSDPSVGVFRVLERAARDLQMPLDSLLERVETLVIGTTVATNIMVEQHGARVGLLCTEGFRDTLAIRRGIRDNVWDLRRPHPQVMVPRHLRVGVPGRIDAEGQVGTPLDEAAVARAVAFFREQGVEAVAISLFNSYLNDVHERRAAEIVCQAWPEVFLSVSSQILPVMGEYERTSTVVVSAFVGPKTSRYLHQLTDSLRRRGLPRPPWIMQSNGGVISPDALAATPVQAVLSGPAAGAAAAAWWSRLSASEDMVFFDMGGTSTDISFSRGGRSGLTDQTSIEGYHVAVPTVDIKTIGTGGGTIAYVDRGGMLRVGPRSAGSEPGPVAYRLGGAEPTVTDANLVLGRLDAENFLGGEMALDLEAARQAIDERIANPLGLDAGAAAHAIISLGNQNMVNAVREVAAESGLDLRRMTLLAAGGASGLHVCEIARLLGIRKLYVPREAAVACAFGMLQSDVRHDVVHAVGRALASFDTVELVRQIQSAEREALAALADGGVNAQAVLFEPSLDLRYRGQAGQISVPLTVSEGGPLLDDAVERFHGEHERLYGYRDEAGAVEVVNLHLTAVSQLPRVDSRPGMPAAAAAASPRTHRPVWSGPDGYQPVPIYDGPALQPGQRIRGPAVVEERHTTVFLGADSELLVDKLGNFAITLETA